MHCASNPGGWSLRSVCKHGIEPRHCAHCLEISDSAPLAASALVITLQGCPALILRTASGSRGALALVLDCSEHPLREIRDSDLRPFGDRSDHRTTTRQLGALAMKLGFIFHPSSALTKREATSDGPTHCYSCKSELSYAKRSLGCTRCRSYVCTCGRCLCGYTGKNYLGQLFRKFPSLPIPRRERLLLVRAVMFCARAA